MSNIPIFSYKQYLNDMSRLTQTGTIDAGQQAEAPISAGARGLKKTKAFIDEPVHMMGESTGPRPGPANPNPNSIVEDIKSLINKINEIQSDTEASSKEKTIEEAFDYHIKNNIPFRENIFRPGSDKYFELFNHARKQYDEGNLKCDWEDAELLESDIGTVVKLVNGYSVPLDQPFEEEDLNEAEYAGKNVELNKPKRGGPKKFYVYVKNPKTGRVKKVTWGDTTGLSVKASKPGRVKSFVARHNCKQKNDKTKAGYWACRTPRYKNLGVKGGAWW